MGNQSQELNDTESITLLQSLQNCWPVESDHWVKMDTLTFVQAVLLYYDIEPSAENPCSSYSGFQGFIQKCDIDHIGDLLQSSFPEKHFSSSPLLNGGKLSTVQFCEWLDSKGLDRPDIFAEIDTVSSVGKKPILLKQLKDIRRINFNEMPPHILKALGANVIAQVRQRINRKNGCKNQISDTINTKLMKSFFDDCCSMDQQTPSMDTIREYIENQFHSDPPA
jgi:hypothetical protein